MMPVHRDLCKTPPFAQFLRQAQISILEISIYSCGWNPRLPWT